MIRFYLNYQGAMLKRIDLLLNFNYHFDKNEVGLPPEKTACFLNFTNLK
jgi:hypothetical protein